MQSEKPQHEVLIENARSRMENSRSKQMLSADARVGDSREDEKERLSRQIFFEGRSTHLSLLSRKENYARENAPWAFEMIDAFSERVNHSNCGAKIHIHLEFTDFETVRGPKKIDDYASGLLSATLHMEAEPDLSKDGMNRWAEEMRSSIIRNANGLVSRHTGVRKPYRQKGMLVEFRARIGVEHAEQNEEETWKKVYAPTERKKEEISQFLGLIERAITDYNDNVSKYASMHKENDLSGLARE
ncbi:MAG: hypothetical protein M1520_00675 [Candidatus Marsarchaeota archaeon]|nr:hypothetical protein [Candidatus Marsarchaeota archaeon]